MLCDAGCAGVDEAGQEKRQTKLVGQALLFGIVHSFFSYEKQYRPERWDFSGRV